MVSHGLDRGPRSCSPVTHARVILFFLYCIGETANKLKTLTDRNRVVNRCSVPFLCVRVCVCVYVSRWSHDVLAIASLLILLLQDVFVGLPVRRLASLSYHLVTFPTNYLDAVQFSCATEASNVFLLQFCFCGYGIALGDLSAWNFCRVRLGSHP